MREKRNLKSSRMRRTLLILVFAFIGVMNSVNAQDVITLQWWCGASLGYNRSFSVDATESEKFIVDWGDGHVDTYTGIGSEYLTLAHTYPTTRWRYDVTITAITDECIFHRFNCSNQTINMLDVSKCTALTDLDCSNNNLAYPDLVILNIGLKVLDCSNSGLWKGESLERITNNCVELITLNCSNNQLFGLDLSTNTKLQQLYCNNCRLGGLNISNCRELIELQCNNNRLTELILDSNSMLERIECYGNRLQLSDLYNISEIISDGNNKLLGTQFLESVIYTANIGESFFTNQAELSGIFTDYLVAYPDPYFPPFYPDIFYNQVPSDYYTIDSGQIIFNKKGYYYVKMTNDAIVSHSDYPANVIGLLEVKSATGILENTTFNIRVFPNPTKDKFVVECENFSTIKLYDMLGKEVLNQNISGKSEINISHLPKGVYSVNVFSEGKLIENSKIVKQ
jgi:hypothetical protein